MLTCDLDEIENLKLYDKLVYKPIERKSLLNEIEYFYNLIFQDK